MNKELQKLIDYKNHIIQNNKDDDNYEDQLKYINKKIEDYKFKQTFDEDKFIEEHKKSYNKLKNNLNNNVERKKFIYNGPVYEFNKLISNTNKPYVTYAKSEKQAINNIQIRIKNDMKREKNAKITIDSKKITTIE